MNKKHVFASTRRFLKQEMLELITIFITTIAFHEAGNFIQEHAHEHQYLASYMPNLVIIAPIALYSFRFAILYKKSSIMQRWQTAQPIKDRHYNSKLVVTAFNASTFLMADIVLVYALAMSFFAFGFNAGNAAFPAAWSHVRMAEIAFPLLSVFALVCMRRK